MCYILFRSINCINITKQWRNGYHWEEIQHQGEGNGTSSIEVNITESTTECSYNEPKYCYDFTPDMVALYAQTAGWILLAVVICGVLLKVLTHWIACISMDPQVNVSTSVKVATDSAEVGHSGDNSKTIDRNEYDYMRVKFYV